MTLFTEDPLINIGAAKTLSDRFDPTFDQLLSASIGVGFDMTSGAALSRIIDFKTPGDSPIMSKDQYKGSKFFREGIEHFDSMTESHAEILADKHDTREKRNFILGHAKGGLDFSLVLAGGLLGSIPDPVNFIPIFGVGAKIAQVAKLGKVAKKLRTISEARTLSIGGRTLRSSAEATIGAGATIPFIAKAEQLEQGDFDMRMVASILGFSAVIGGGFGALSHAFRGITTKDKVDATSKALSDMVEGKPVDVEPILGARVNKASVRDLIKRHVNGEDVSQDAIIHPKLGKAEELISEFRSDGVRGEDILRTIRSTSFTRDKIDELIHEAIDDVSGLREVLQAFDVGGKGTKEQITMLGSFKNSTEENFNISRIADNEAKAASLKTTIRNNEAKFNKIEKKLDEVKLTDQDNAVVKEAKKRGFTKEEIDNFKTTQKGKQETALFIKRQNKVDDINRLTDELRRTEANIETLKAKQAVLKSGRAEVDFATGKAEEIIPDVEVRTDPEVKDIESLDVVNERLEETTAEFNSRLEAEELPASAKNAVEKQRKINAKDIKEAEAWKLAADCVVNG